MVKKFNECTIQSDEQVDTIVNYKEHSNAKNWLRNDYAKQVDVINDSEILVLGGSDPKSNQSVATHTIKGISATDITNGILTRKLFPCFMNQAIQAVVQLITPLVTVEVKVMQESLSRCQISLPQANVIDVGRPCASIFGLLRT